MPSEDDRPPGGQHISGERNIQVGRDLNLTVAPAVPMRATPVHVQRVIRRLEEEIAHGEQQRGELRNPADVELKLTYNEVERFRQFIVEYGSYGHAVEGAYSAVDDANPQSRAKVTRFIRALYVEIATSPEDLSSDDKLRMLVLTLKERVAGVDLAAEEVEPCCNMLVAHAFIGCTILERPPQQC